MSVERIEADYLVETAYDPWTAVEAMAGEQSCGTFLPVPGETPELKGAQRRASKIWKCWARPISRAFPDRVLPTRAEYD